MSDAVGTYDPNGPLAIVAFIAFGSTAAGFAYRYFKTRPRAKYMRTICFGSFFMSLGYIIRFSRRNGINAWAFIFETLCLLLSPCAFIAQIYILLPRLATHTQAEDCLWLSRKVLVRLFLMVDILSVLGQIAGTALQATFGDLVRIGVIVTAISLWIQLAFSVLFASVVVIFRLRQLNQAGQHEKWTTVDRHSLSNLPASSHWKMLYIAICIACLCMLVRTAFRCLEYTIGVIDPGNAFTDSEAAFYLLDGIPMLLLVLCFVLVWPPKCLEA